MKKKSKRPMLLASSRPLRSQQTASLSSGATRSLVRNHHTLRKKLHRARTDNQIQEIQALQEQIMKLGGLSSYQQASIQGQSAARGGDSSKVLVGWFNEIGVHARSDAKVPDWRMLEVGALKIDNACARCGLFNIERIDLHSQDPSIKEQDFMDRPIPSRDQLFDEGFDVVSLSLVLNFVDDAAERGEMLSRVTDFLRATPHVSGNPCRAFPSLFFVLPAACVFNSRYLDAARLEGIMGSLGFSVIRSKTSTKLVYYLFRYHGKKEGNREAFRKQEVRSGKMRNNFAIVLR